MCGLALRAQSNLGEILVDLNRLDGALALLKDCLDTRRTLLGDDHPYTITSIGNLASLYSNAGRYDEAVALLREAGRA